MVISECVVCALNKEMAIAEMIRILTPGGFIGIHDIFWKEDTPNDLKVRLKAIENESPEHWWDGKNYSVIMDLKIVQ